MTSRYDFAVVGKGLMGAAAARHLAEAGADVALVGPDEPDRYAAHTGVFASHYDAGRITRTIDEDPVWGRLARLSIERYRDIEARSGIGFYGEVGCVITAPASTRADDTMARMLDARDRVGADADLLSSTDLRSAFPFLRFPEGYAALHEPRRAGHIDPRALVLAQSRLAALAGAAVKTVEVLAVHDRASHAEVATANGETLRCDRVLVAAGGFSIRPALLPRRLDLTIKARTVVLAEIDTAERDRLAGMPSVIQSAPSQADSFYCLPPIRYPNGRTYLKLGGDPQDRTLRTENEIKSWFRGDGDPVASAHMRRHLETLLPGLRARNWTTRPCVTTFTRHGYPYIGFVGGDRIIALTGGNGQAAKSSDEIGRLGAVLATTGTIEDQGYSHDFAPAFATDRAIHVQT